MPAFPVRLTQSGIAAAHGNIDVGESLNLALDLALRLLSESAPLGLVGGRQGQGQANC
jgi:hypothetical protein